MNIFCAYAFTGEDIDILTRRMRLVVDTLNQMGNDAYCNRFDPVVDDLQARDDIVGIFNEAFKNITAADVIVAVITSASRSVGQIMEIGAALSQAKPVYIVEHESATGSSYLPRLAAQHVTWSDEQSLRQALNSLEFKGV